MDSMVEKHAIRDRMKSLRRALLPEERAKAAELVFHRLQEFEPFRKADSVFIYLAARRELETRRIIEALFQRKATVLVPFTLPEGVMIPRVLRSFDDQIMGTFKIPTSKGPVFEESPSLCLVPALAFDRKGHRVGYGGGYYDRFLAINPNATRLGVGYDFQLIEHAPTQSTDIPLHHLLTPSHSLTFNP